MHLALGSPNTCAPPCGRTPALPWGGRLDPGLATPPPASPPGSAALCYFCSQNQISSLWLLPSNPCEGPSSSFRCLFRESGSFLEAQFFLLCFLHLTRQNTVTLNSSVHDRLSSLNCVGTVWSCNPPSILGALRFMTELALHLPWPLGLKQYHLEV